MRTIRTKVYSFNELSDNAKQVAVNGFSGNMETDFIYDDAHNTVKSFHKTFNTQEKSTTWLDWNGGNIDRDILELKGLRLRTWFINNYSHIFYSKKAYWFCINKDGTKRFNCVGENGGKYVSNCQTEINSCPLTGVYHDGILLQPIYDFIDNYKQKADYYSYIDFETLINDCFSNLEKYIDSEVEAQNSFEYISDYLLSNEYEFTQDGNRFTS